VAIQLGDTIVVGTGTELRSFEIAELWKSGFAVVVDRSSPQALD